MAGAPLSRLLSAVCMAALLAAPASASTFTVPVCKAAAKQPDGSWLIWTTTNFGRAGTINSSAIVYDGTIIHGVNLGAFLDRRCHTRYALIPDYPPYVYAPNGYWNRVVPAP